MKKIFFVFLGWMALAGTMVISSCTKISTAEPIIFSTPLQALINSDTSLSVFYAAVQQARDTALYGGTDSAIVLIPTNAAFASKGITAAGIRGMSAASADSLLRYHFIPGAVALTAGTYTAFTSKLGPVVYGYGNPDSVGNYFNGILATAQKLPGSNATVYELSAPLKIPSGTAAQLIAADTSLMYFAEAVKHTGFNLNPASGWNTILAPVNSAFIAAGYPDLQSIDNADVNALTALLNYHLLPGQYFSNGFYGLTNVATAGGNNINISFSNGLVQFTGTGNSTAAGIITADRITNNIIFQNINGVLMQ